MAKLRPRTPPPAPGPALPEPRPRRLDPRWMLSPHAGRIAAHIYYLMLGVHPSSGTRLHGWVAEAVEDPSLDNVWRLHRESLIAEAAAAGFTPWKLTQKRPTGAGVDRWAQNFVAQHRY
jgi:hypothetical protein